MQISIDIKQNAGTVAWVANHLSNLEIELRQDKTGNFPYLAYRAKWEETPSKESEPAKEIWYKLAVPQMEPGQARDVWDYSFFMKEDKRHYVLTAWPVKTEYRWGMFSYLTKAANTMVNGFLAQVAETFQSYLEADETAGVEFKIQIVNKPIK